MDEQEEDIFDTFERYIYKDVPSDSDAKGRFRDVATYRLVKVERQRLHGLRMDIEVLYNEPSGEGA